MAVAILHARRQRHRELDELVVEERLAALDRARHRDAIHAREQQLRQALAKLEIGHALEEVGVPARGSPSSQIRSTVRSASWCRRDARVGP